MVTTYFGRTRDNGDSKMTPEQQRAYFAKMKDSERKSLFKKLSDTHRTGLAQDTINHNYPHIFRKTAQNKGCMGNEKGFNRFDKNGNPQKVEAVCGASTSAIHEHLKKKLGNDSSTEMRGFYVGLGKENSEAYNPHKKMVEHEWIKLSDGTIVDGARGQLLPNNLERNDLTKEDRLKFIPPMSPEQGFYKTRSPCKKCASMLFPNESCSGCKIIDELSIESKKRGISIKELNRERMESKMLLTNGEQAMKLKKEIKELEAKAVLLENESR